MSNDQKCAEVKYTQVAKDTPIKDQLIILIDHATPKLKNSNGFILVAYECNEENQRINFNVCAFNQGPEIVKQIATQIPILVDAVVQTAIEKSMSTIH